MAEQEIIRDLQRAKGEYQKLLGRAEQCIAELTRERDALRERWETVSTSILHMERENADLEARLERAQPLIKALAGALPNDDHGSLAFLLTDVDVEGIAEGKPGLPTRLVEQARALLADGGSDHAPD